MSKKNILFLGVKYSNIAGDDKGRLTADMKGGSGFYACEGHMIPVNWQLSTNTGLILTKENGQTLKLAVGKSYFCMYNSRVGDAVKVEEPKAE